MRNLPDGRVEMEIQGAAVSLRRLYLRLKSQPPIRITHADITEIPPRDGERSFSVSRGDSL